MSRRNLRIEPNPAAVAIAAARLVLECAGRSVEARGGFRLVLPGGRSIAGLLAELVRDPARLEMDWASTTILFADERAVGPDHPDSNYRLIREGLIDPLGDLAPRVRRMRGEAADLEVAAREYDAELADPADLVVLGLGEDGHVASLFPGAPLLGERRLRAACVLDSPKPPARRITLTPRALFEAREGTLVLALGADKSAALRLALAPGADPLRVPAALVASGRWIVDRAAAGE